MQNTRDVVLVGSISIDRIMNFGGHYKDLIQPDKIHVLSISILVDRLTNSKGGIAPNIAYTLSLLGDSSTILSSIGTDGKEYLSYLTERGIDTSHIYVSNVPTSTFTVLTDIDDNQVGGFYPGAMGDSSSLSLDPFNKDSIVVISAYDPKAMKRLVKQAKERDMTLLYDIGQQVSNVPVEDLKEGVDRADLIILNDYELGVLAARLEVKEKTLEKSIPLMIVTLGSKGARVTGTSVSTPLTIKPVTGVTVVDPTGAGDAFRSGFLYGYRRGWQADMNVRLGNITASYALEHHGTQEHDFTIDQIKERYYSTYGEQLTI